MGELTRDTLAEKRRIEAMTTAVLAADPFAQRDVATGLTNTEEAYVRAAAGIIAGIFTALGQRIGIAPSEAWERHMAGTSRSRGPDA